MLMYRPSSLFICKEVCTPVGENGVWEELPQTIASFILPLISLSFVVWVGYSWVS